MCSDLRIPHSVNKFPNTRSDLIALAFSDSFLGISTGPITGNSPTTTFGATLAKGSAGTNQGATRGPGTGPERNPQGQNG